MAIFEVGFPLHKPYPYSLYRWGFLHLDGTWNVWWLWMPSRMVFTDPLRQWTFTNKNHWPLKQTHDGSMWPVKIKFCLKGLAKSAKGFPLPFKTQTKTTPIGSMGGARYIYVPLVQISMVNVSKKLVGGWTTHLKMCSSKFPIGVKIHIFLKPPPKKTCYTSLPSILWLVFLPHLARSSRPCDPAKVPGERPPVVWKKWNYPNTPGWNQTKRATQKITGILFQWNPGLFIGIRT